MCILTRIHPFENWKSIFFTFHNTSRMENVHDSLNCKKSNVFLLDYSFLAECTNVQKYCFSGDPSGMKNFLKFPEISLKFLKNQRYKTEFCLKIISKVPCLKYDAFEISKFSGLALNRFLIPIPIFISFLLFLLFKTLSNIFL